MTPTATTRTAKDAPALIRAGLAWGLAAVFGRDAAGRRYGKASWNPSLPEERAKLWIHHLATLANMDSD